MPARKTAHAQVSHNNWPGKKRSFQETDHHSPKDNVKDPELRTKKVEVIRAP
jgi:hypothetical protein